MLLQPRHDLDQIAGAVANIELEFQNPIPAVAARSGRSRKAEDIGAAGDAAAGSRLNGRGRDFLEGQHVKEDRETLDLFFE